MELHKIKMLLEKYEDGNTSLIEEKILQDYFNSGNIDSQLEDYRLLFNYTSTGKAIIFPKEVEIVKSKTSPLRRNIFAITGIAASIILAIGLFVTVDSGDANVNKQYLGTIDDPEEAYFKAKETLQMVSEVLNSGTQELNYVAEFDKVKNQYLKE